MKPNNIFFEMFFVSLYVSKSLVLPGTSDVTVMSLVPGRTTDCSPCLSPHTQSELDVCFERIFCLWNQKPLNMENYTILNKINVPMWQITTLMTWQMLFFLQCILVHVGTAWTAVRAGQTQKTRLSLSIKHKLRNLLLQLTTVTINIDWTSTWKVVMEFSFKIVR